MSRMLRLVSLCLRQPPLTPAVLQAPKLQAQHLPPQALPFTRQARVAQARASELEQELPAAEQEELQAEAANATQEWEVA